MWNLKNTINYSKTKVKIEKKRSRHKNVNKKLAVTNGEREVGRGSTE